MKTISPSWTPRNCNRPQPQGHAGRRSLPEIGEGHISTGLIEANPNMRILARGPSIFARQVVTDYSDDAVAKESKGRGRISAKVTGGIQRLTLKPTDRNRVDVRLLKDNIDNEYVLGIEEPKERTESALGKVPRAWRTALSPGCSANFGW